MKFRIYKELIRIRKQLTIIENKENEMSAELDALTLEVADTNTIMQSAIVLIQGLAAQLQAIANDPAAILQLAADLDAQSDALAAAVAANTPPPVP
jgi:hypothetical protein